MSDLFVAPNAFELLNEVGILDYGARLDANFGKISTVVSAVDDRVTTLEGTTILGQGDAAANIPNLCINGDFTRSYCAPPIESGAWYSATWPYADGGGNAYALVRWADGWFYGEEAGGGVGTSINPFTVNLAAVALDGAYKSIKVGRGSGSPYTGTIYQRLDLYYDLRNFHNRTVQFAVNYNAVNADEFYLEIDDGVTVSTNSALPSPGPSPAGTGTSRVSHTVSSVATKLVVRIVIQDANVAGSELQILYAHARLGSALASLITGTPPPSPIDDVACQLTSFVMHMPAPMFSRGVTDSAATDSNTIIFPLRVPIVAIAASDVKANATVLLNADATVTNMGALGTAPALTLHDGKRWGINSLAPGNTPRVMYNSGKLTLSRSAPDVYPVGLDGFSALDLYLIALSIPSP